MCIDCRLDLWRGSERGVSSQRRGLPGWLAAGRMAYHRGGGQTFVPWKVRNGSRGCSAPVAWTGQARPRQFDLDPKTVLFIMRYRQLPISYVGFAARSRSPACDLGDRLGTPRTTGR